VGFNYLPFMVIFVFIFLIIFFSSWKTIKSQKTVYIQNTEDIPITKKKIGLSLFLIIAVVVIRSWIQVGLMTYIPFYYIDYLKTDPFYAGQLVFVLLLGGAVGTLAGALLADHYGHKKFLVFSLLLTSLLFPLILILNGIMLFIVLGLFGAMLVSPCTATIVMAQQLLPKHLGLVSGLMAGFAIGMGGAGVTILGIVADNFGVPLALQSITILPLIGLGMSLLIRLPRNETTNIVTC